MTLVPVVDSIMPTIPPVLCIRPTISLIIHVVAPTSVVLLLIFVKEMRGEWTLIPHASHFLLGQVPSIVILGPVAWIGLLFILATGVAALCFIFAIAAHKPCHVDTKSELWLAPYGVAKIHHVDARKRARVSFDPDVVRTGLLKGADEFGFTDGLQLIVFLLMFCREILVLDRFIRHPGRRC